MNRNIQELRQITPQTALYYSFHTPSSSSLHPSSSLPTEPSPTDILGVTAALNELHNAGCALATKEWVENHWCLILWKLAGMVCLDPESELVEGKKRWCWGEVMRQLRYRLVSTPPSHPIIICVKADGSIARYERELNTASRPPLRLIAAQDSPASLPMVLCISNITWSSPSTSGGLGEGEDEHGQPMESIPDVEVTDGWYRMRLEVDGPIRRALRRGVLSVGRKIGVAGARVHVSFPFDLRASNANDLCAVISGTERRCRDPRSGRLALAESMRQLVAPRAMACEAGISEGPVRCDAGELDGRWRGRVGVGCGHREGTSGSSVVFRW